MKLKKYILPVGIIIVLIISLANPSTGIYTIKYYAVEISVIATFLVYGYLHRLNEFRRDNNFIKGLILVSIINLVVCPILGTGTAFVVLPAVMGIGLIVMSCMPPTLSSGVVITDAAGGNVVLALIFTITLNILALFTIPIMLSLWSGAVYPVTISPFLLFYKLLLIVFIPFAAGRVIRKITKIFLDNKIIHLIPTLCILLAVWVCMSSSSDSLKEMKIIDLIVILAAVLFVHCILLFMNYVAGTLIKLNSADKKAMVFVGSQKTLPLAAFVISTLALTDAAPIIVCIIFHFTQLLLDSLIASVVNKIEDAA
jgi:solute carrier family 10 (sodium/bile acid cotransporter), member 7